MKSQRSMESVQECIKQKIIDVKLLDIQLKKGRSANILCQNVQIIVVIFKLPHSGAQ